MTQTMDPPADSTDWPEPMDEAKVTELREWRKRVTDQNRIVSERLRDYAQCKEATKDAKEAWEVSVMDLQRLINDEPGSLPLLDNAVASAAEEWRSVLLSTLQIKPKTLKALSEHQPPITTLGELADWQAKKGDFWSTDIKGIGEAAAAEIADAAARYWTDHPQPVPAAPAPEKTDDLPSLDGEAWRIGGRHR